MHTNRLLLVKAKDKSDALKQAKEFIEPYGDGKVWDWYQVGGRWAWESSLWEKYKDKIVDSNNNYKREDEIVTVEFPDGTSKQCKGPIWTESAIKEYIDAHGEDSEVIDATHPDFFKHITENIKYMNDSCKRMREGLLEEVIDIHHTRNRQQKLTAKEKAAAGKIVLRILMNDVPSEQGSGLHMDTYYLSGITDLLYGEFSHDTTFYNVEDGNTRYDEATIKANPTEYFLVNFDTHN